MNASNRITSMSDWMEYINPSQIHINHKMNTGSMTRIGPYLVDRYDPMTDVVYEFLGYYFRGQPCTTPKKPV